MARKSAAALSIVQPVLAARLEPPGALSKDQALVWSSVVASKPADWWDSGSLDLLVAYCRAVCEHRRVSSLLDKFKTECLTETDSSSLERYDRLVRIQVRLSGQMVTLATKMRLTQQAKYRADAAEVAARRVGSNPEKRARPWEGVVIDG